MGKLTVLEIGEHTFFVRAMLRHAVRDATTLHPGKERWRGVADMFGLCPESAIALCVSFGAGPRDVFEAASDPMQAVLASMQGDESDEQ